MPLEASFLNLFGISGGEVVGKGGGGGGGIRDGKGQLPSGLYVNWGNNKPTESYEYT